MAENEKQEASHDVHTPEISSHENHEIVLPQGRLYRSPRLFGKNLPWYASPETQVVIVAFVCFLCPGKPISHIPHHAHSFNGDD
jgi:hypothetical protein